MFDIPKQKGFLCSFPAERGFSILIENPANQITAISTKPLNSQVGGWPGERVKFY